MCAYEEGKNGPRLLFHIFRLKRSLPGFLYARAVGSDNNAVTRDLIYHFTYGFNPVFSFSLCIFDDP